METFVAIIMEISSAAIDSMSSITAIVMVRDGSQLVEGWQSVKQTGISL